MTVPVPSERPRRLVIYGRPSDLFQALLPEGPIWRRFPELEVLHARTRLQLIRLAGERSSFVIPIWGTEAARCPPWWWMLRPDRLAVAALGDKLAFARYIRREGLDALVPRTFLPGEVPVFPVAVKPADGVDGRGVSFAARPEELTALLADRDRRRKRQVVQERIEGDCDLATHVVCRAGRVLWHRSYRYRLNESGVQSAATVVERGPYEATSDEIASFERLLLPLSYDGPAVVDWRRRQDGRLAVFEINPRFGSSLMRPENEADLEAAIRVLLDAAQPRRRFGS